MSDRSSRDESWHAAFPKPLLDALGPVNPWHPVVMAVTKTNDCLAEGFATVFGEWQTFLGRRVQQDVLLWQNAAKSASPRDVVAAQADFWQEAIADYWQEYATMSKLLAGITGNVNVPGENCIARGRAALTIDKSGMKVRPVALPLSRGRLGLLRSRCSAAA